MKIADTSLLYALFSEDDVHHEEARDLVSKSETIYIPSDIWSETISLIHYRKGYEQAVRSGKALLDLPHVDLLASRMDIVRYSWKIYRKSDGNLSFPDCVVLTWCEVKNAEPLTFDKYINDHYEENIYSD
ncbi:MAG: PIN domain-containing protein [Thermoplasmatota archaeon]